MKDKTGNFSGAAANAQNLYVTAIQFLQASTKLENTKELRQPLSFI